MEATKKFKSCVEDVAMVVVSIGGGGVDFVTAELEVV
jgi:hypothetical protein